MRQSWPFLVLVTLFLSCVFTSQPGAAALTGSEKRNPNVPLLSFSFSVVDNHTEILVKAGKPLELYKSFLLDSPRRFVLDVENAGLSKSFFKMSVDREELRSIRAAQHEQKVRFVFDLPEDRKTEQRIVPWPEGLKIIIAPAAEKEAPAPATPATQPRQDVSPTGVETKPELPQDNTVEPMDKLYTGEKISIKLYRANVSDFFGLISEVSGVPIEVASDVNDEISLRLQDVPWDQALDLVVSFYGFKLEKTNKGFFLSRGQGPSK